MLFFGLSALQILLAIVALFFLVTSAIRYFRGEQNQSLLKFLATIAVWGIFLVIAVLPQLTHSVSQSLGLGQNLNTLIFIGFVAVFAVLFKLLNILERIERTISEIVRKEVLRKLDDKK